MGQKVNPTGFRLSVNRDWRSRWYASPQEFPSFLHSDLKIRNYVKKKLQFAAVSKIVIERAWNSIRVTIHNARARCSAHRRERCAPDRAADCISPRDEKSGADRDGFWRRRNSSAVFGPAQWRRDFALGMVPRGKNSAAHVAHLGRLRLCRGKHSLWQDWCEMLDL